jgi:hypothetical protein
MSATSGLARWQWVQGIARILERDIPEFGNIALRFVRQVDAYLTCQEIREAVDNIVRPSILKGPTVIVAHSLGSVITYRLLREAQSAAEVPLFVTLGSPLGFHAVKQYLNPPSLAVPIAVRTCSMPPMQETAWRFMPASTATPLPTESRTWPTSTTSGTTPMPSPTISAMRPSLSAFTPRFQARSVIRPGPARCCHGRAAWLQTCAPPRRTPA